MSLIWYDIVRQMLVWHRLHTKTRLRS